MYDEQHSGTKLHLTNEGGFAAHIGSGDDVEPRVPLLHDAVIGYELHTVLGLYVRMTARCNTGFQGLGCVLSGSGLGA